MAGEKILKCEFYIERKKRHCKMLAKSGTKYCVEHGVGKNGGGGGDGNGNDGVKGDRTPCPYDPKHSCYLSKLKKHMKKCNSRPGDPLEYIKPGTNLFDNENEREEEEEDVKYSISSVSDDLLMSLIEKINFVYDSEGLMDCDVKVLSHDVVAPALNDGEMGTNAKKHLMQNSSILKNMEENNFLRSSVTYVEFGAGRGQLGYWISQAVKNEENCCLILIDKASHRHKSDNKLKGNLPIRTLRIRADIADVDLWKISTLASGNDVVGVCKHLCGAATDLALRCLVKGRENGLKITGTCMAFCCHHRCSWSSYVGKKFLTDVGFVPRQFSALCSITSWATCGSGKPRRRREKESSECERKTSNANVDPDRYGKFGLTQEVREKIGRKCKMIINRGRLKYLEDHGFSGKLIFYVDENVSPENVCVMATTK